MNISYILIAIVVLIGLVAIGFALLKRRGTPLVEARYGRRIHIGVAIGVSLLMIAIWLLEDLPIGILPALMIPQWITLFGQDVRGQAGLRQLPGNAGPPRH